MLAQDSRFRFNTEIRKLTGRTRAEREREGEGEGGREKERDWKRKIRLGETYPRSHLGHLRLLLPVRASEEDPCTSDARNSKPCTTDVIE